MKVIKESHTKIGIGLLCMLFGKTRHAYYDKNLHEQIKLKDHELVMELVCQIRREMPEIGTPKLYHMIREPLKSHGIKMGRDSLHSLLAAHNMIVRPKKKHVVITTDSRHCMKKYPNLAKELIPDASQQVWVSDITYLRVGNDFNFLSLVTDAYSKKIVGYALHPTLGTEGCLKALRMALENRSKPDQGLIHHSDRGTQYCCNSYVELLKASDIQISMTEKGDPYENAIAERVNGILKHEFDLKCIFSSAEDALQKTKKSIETYNQLRPHMSCDMLTPDQAHQKSGIMKKKWKPKAYHKIDQEVEKA